MRSSELLVWKTLPSLRLPIRYRYVPDPGTLEQRLFRAVTKPVIPPLNISPTEIRLRRLEEKRIQRENNPYRKFLVEKARQEFFQFSSGRLILVFQPLYHMPRDFITIRNQLFHKGLIFRGFPKSILQEAAKGTHWDSFCEFFLQTECIQTYLIGDATPEICRDALKILRKAPFLLLLGGLVQYRIMTVDELNKFADISMQNGLEGLYFQCLGILDKCRGQKLVEHFSHHQSTLLTSLKQHSSQSS